MPLCIRDAAHSLPIVFRDRCESHLLVTFTVPQRKKTCATTAAILLRTSLRTGRGNERVRRRGQGHGHVRRGRGHEHVRQRGLGHGHVRRGRGHEHVRCNRCLFSSRPRVSWNTFTILFKQARQPYKVFSGGLSTSGRHKDCCRCIQSCTMS